MTKAEKRAKAMAELERAVQADDAEAGARAALALFRDVLETLEQIAAALDKIAERPTALSLISGVGPVGSPTVSDDGRQV